MENRFHVFPANNFIDLGIYQMGMEQCLPGHSFGPASRNHFLFHYVLGGSGILYFTDAGGSDQVHKIGKDEGFLLMPGQITTYIADSKTPWQYMWLEFDGLRVQETLEIAGFSIDSPVYSSKKPPLREALRSQMLYIVEHEDASMLELIGRTYLFLDLLTRSLTSRPIPVKSKLRNFYIAEAIAFIEENYQKDISIEEIANNCGLNRSYFGKIFKEDVGSTPQKFLLNYRMVKATELLQHTEMPISDISPLVGYPNQLHFSRAFKGHFGISPRHWRNENKVILLHE